MTVDDGMNDVRASKNFAASVHKEPLLPPPSWRDNLQCSPHTICSDVLGLIFGNALLTLPYGLVMTGWLGLVIFAITLVLLGYTSMLLATALGELENRGIRDAQYGDIAAHAFGHRARPFIECVYILECAFVSIYMLVFASSTLSPICGLSNQTLIYLTTLLGISMVPLPQQYVVFVKLVGISLTTICLAVAMWSGLALIGPESPAPPFSGTEGLKGSATTASLVMFAAADHPWFVGLYKKAGASKVYRQGIVEAFVIFYICSVVLCAVCYGTYGTKIHKVVLNNVGHDANGKLENGWAWLAVFSNTALSLRGIVLLPCFVEPVVTYTLQRFHATTGVDLSMPLSMQSDFESMEERNSKLLLRVLLVALVYAACACCADFFADMIIVLEVLAAAVFKTMNAFVVPCLGCWFLCRRSLSRVEAFGLSAALTCGLCVSIVGMASSLHQILTHDGFGNPPKAS